MKRRIFIVILTAMFHIGRSQVPTVTNLLNDVRIDSMKMFVEELTGLKQVVINGVLDTINSRYAYSPGNAKAFYYLKQKFQQYGLSVDSLAFNPTGKNVFGIKYGTKYPNQKYILGAHYDNHPPFNVAPGADDNASGTAAVIEAARIFSNYNFSYTIVFAGWDEEELGLLGSIAYVNNALSNNDSILGYINLDMLGWDGNNDSIADINVKPVANSLALANKALMLNTTYSIGLSIHTVNPGNTSTDHAPFWNNGLTAIGIDEAYDTDFNPYWHTLADSLGQFNLSYYERVAKLAYATLAECALDTAYTIGINEPQIFDNTIQLYPNPFSESLSVSFANPVSSMLRLTIVNTLGEICYVTILPEGINRHTVEMNTLNPGIYYYQVKLLNGQIIEQGKIIKMN